MQFWALFKKILFYYGRNWKGTCCEILAPIVLIIFIIGLRGLVDVIEIDELTYPATPIFTSVSDILNSDQKEILLKNIVKDCSEDNRQGGRVAFAPRNQITEELAKFFEARNDTVIFFENIDELNDYVTIPEYTLKFENGTRRQFCLAVTVDEFDEQNFKFSYNLKFNLTNPSRVDHIDSREYKDYKIPFKVNDMEQYDILNRQGTLTLQLLIDQFILKKSFPNIDLGIQTQAFKSPSYKRADYSALPLELFFILIGIIVFLRIISMVVNEREKRIIENMENMGMKKINYIGSSLLFHILLYFIISLYMVPLIKAAFIRQTNIGLIFIIFWLYMFTSIALAYFISCFFVKSKNAIITGLIIFFILYFFTFLWEPLWEQGQGTTTFIALSPIGGISQVSRNLLQTESSFFYFSFGDINQSIYNFKISTFFIICSIELLLFILLTFYCFYVVPLSIGVAEHPLFFLGFNRKKKNNKIQQQNTSDEEQLEINNSNFEEVEQEYMIQKEQNTTIQIKNLTKKYGNGKVAVNNLNLEIFQDQIFALLGHNGAGKTTVISMISGLLDKTSGVIKVMGYDSQSNRKEIKKLIGVCPQVNPIFDYLTVEEHLRLYGKIKGVQNNISDDEINEILTDIDLLHKKKYKAKFLSGGQKRKLCVAMAFIGGSKIILLDEPTSGMDTYARRLLWEMIKKYKKNRLIILTTHFMDEADFLGDRIGIMSDGELIVCGSSLFLKKKFGAGYELTIVKKQNMQKEQVQVLINKIKEICQNSKYISEIGTELKIQLIEDDSQQFQQLFEYLENNYEELNYESFGIGLTTLEEVFLKISSQKEKKEYEEFIQQQDSSDKQENIIISNDNIDNKNLKSLKYKKNSQIFFSQIKALFVKRFIYFSRDKISLLCQILIPLIAVLLALGISKIDFINVPDTVQITKDIYQNQILLNKFPTNFEEQKNLFPSDIITIDAQTSEEFNNKIYKQSSEDNEYGIYFDQTTPSDFQYIAFYNTTTPAGAYIGVNIANNALLKSQKGNNSYIKTYLEPFKETQGVKNLEATFDGFIIALVFGLAFSFIPSSMIVFVIKEREFNAKHQQLISGMNIFAYWISNFIVDYIIYLFIGILSYILLFVFDVKSLTQDDRWVMSLFLFLFYGFGFIPFIYFLSFFFKKPSAGQVAVFLIAFFFGMFLVIIGFALRIIEDTRYIARDFLDYVFRLVPFFSFNYGILNLGNLDLYKLVYEYDKVQNPFHPFGVLFDLLFLILMGIVYSLLILVMEFSYRLKEIKVLNNKEIEQQIQEEEQKEQKEEDVIQEEQMIQQGDLEYNRVYVKDVTKIYQIGNNKLCGKQKNIDYKIAVKKVSFGVQKAQVFCLLGTNGAGKTSLFKMLTGDIQPDNGDVFIEGNKMPDQFNKIRELIGYCPQFDTLLENLTCKEHLNLYCDLKGIDRQYKKYLVSDIIQKMNLQKYKDVQAGTYSGGNKRKLSVAIALIGKPPIIFLDEPSSGMDPYARRFMWGVINDISTQKKDSSIILTTHSMEEAEALSTKLAIMVEGKIKTIGSIQQLKNKYGNCFEVEIKFNKKNKQDLQNIIQDIKQKNNIQDVKVNDEQIKQILINEQQQNLINEIQQGGKGKNIYDLLQKNKTINIDIIIEWIQIQQQLNNLQQVLDQNFGCILLENFQTFARFKMNENTKLSQLFGFFEQNKQQYDLSDYNIKQISLEQIFIKFAQDIRHDDQIIILQYVNQKFIFFYWYKFWQAFFISIKIIIKFKFQYYIYQSFILIRYILQIFKNYKISYRLVNLIRLNRQLKSLSSLNFQQNKFKFKN